MKESNNFLTNRVMKNVLFFVYIFVFIVNAIILIYVGHSVKKSYISEVHTELMEKIQNIDNIFENGIDDINYIITNEYILKNMEYSFSGMKDNYTFSSFAANIIGGFKTNYKEIIIYTDNYTLYDGAYFRRMNHIESIPIYNKILSLPKSETLFQSEENYVNIYRNFSSTKQKNIICMKFKKEYLYAILNQNNKEYMFFDYNGHSINNTDHNELLNKSMTVISGDTITCGISKKVYFTNLIRIFIYDLSILLIFMVAVFFCVKIIIKKSFVNLIEFLELLETNTDENLYNNLSLTDGGNDIKLIKLRIVRLLEKNNLLTKKLSELEKEKHTGDLLLMQAKINPHLIYNTLSVVKWNVLKNNDTKTTVIIDALVKYYRLVLNFGNDVVTVKHEIQMIKEYLNVMSAVRFNNYKLTVNVPEEIMNEKMLKMLFQPVVENSVLHAFENKNNSEIIIKAEKIENDITVYISDNGYGMDSATAAALCNDNAKSPHYGISNVIKRIKLYYGDEYGIEVMSKENEGTTIIYHIRPIT